MAVTAGKGRCVQVRATRVDGWTRERRAGFLDALAESSNIRAAAATVGMSDGGVRRLRARDAEFDGLCRAALEAGYARLEEELIARALGTIGSGDNPAPDEGGPGSREPQRGMDTALALRVLGLRDKRANGVRRPAVQPVDRKTRQALEAAVLRKLDALMRTVKPS